MKEIKLEIPADSEVDKIETQDGHIVVTFREKKRRLPKSWEEFCRINPETKVGESCIMTDSSIRTPGFTSQRFVDKDKNLLPDLATAEAVLALCQLIQLRNAYNGDLVPDWSDSGSWKYAINFCEYPPYKPLFTSQVANKPTFLYFKSEKLRNEFLRNFRPLIEKLKPLYGIKEGGEE